MCRLSHRVVPHADLMTQLIRHDSLNIKLSLNTDRIGRIQGVPISHHLRMPRTAYAYLLAVDLNNDYISGCFHYLDKAKY